MTKSTIVKIGDHEIKLSHLDKILFPKSKVTKGDLVDYYTKITDHMLYFMHNHLITMYRFPNGIDKEKFFQKNVPDYFPNWIKTEFLEHKERSGGTSYAICNNKETLIYLANQVCVLNMWLSKYNNLYHPDRLVWDLDPSSCCTINDFKVVKKAAILIKNFMEEEGLKPFVMTTGSSGMHVTVPLDQSASFDQIKNFMNKYANKLAKEFPNDFTTELSIEKRGNRLFLDTLRNRYGATAVCPYAVRPKEKAPVATPLYWEELDNPNLISQTYNIDNIFDKLKSDGNPWQHFYTYAKPLPKE